MELNNLHEIFKNLYKEFVETYNSSDCFIEDGRTINRQFNNLCLKIWGIIEAPEGTWYKLFREGMLNIANNYNKSLEEALWNNIVYFIQN